MTSTATTIRYEPMKSLLADAHVLTMDDAGTEHPDGWILVEDGVVAAVGSGPEPEADEREALAGAVVTPGLINTHHHLYQTLTRARAQEGTLFEWLVELYPTWAAIDAEAEYAAARTGIAELMLSGCTTVFDHHYVFPRGREGLLEAEVQAARELGCRIVASRGSMDLGVSDGGRRRTSSWRSSTPSSPRPSASRASSTIPATARACRSQWRRARPSRSPAG
jgi:cytosine/adenosine deaminase-related metal-dependent hydrolase